MTSKSLVTLKLGVATTQTSRTRGTSPYVTTKTSAVKSPVVTVAVKKKPQVKVEPKDQCDVRRKRGKPRKRKGTGPGNARVPTSSTSGPLRAPKKGRNLDPNAYSKLRNKSQWWTSIRDPLHGAGTKIPDAVGTETGTFQCVHQTSFTVSPSTVAPETGTWGGIQMFSPYPGISTAHADGSNFQLLDNANCAYNQIQWLGATLPLDTNKTLADFSQGVRVVSAALYVEPEASLSNATGDMTLFVEPWGYQTSNAPWDVYQNNYGTSIMPVNRVTPMVVLWYPCDKEDCEYDAFYEPVSITGNIGSGDGDQRPWSLGVIANGCTDGSKFRVTIVVNYEFIPLKNAVNIVSAAPSRIDIDEEQFVVNNIASAPVTMPVSQKVMSSAPSTAAETPSNGGFGFGAEVLKAMMPFVEAGAELFI